MHPTKNIKERKIKKPHWPRIVGRARNEFGTRLCHRVVCVKCQKVDHVAVRVNEKQNQFCRACAETTIKIFDQGRVIDDEKVSRTCDQCRQTFWVNKQVAGKKEELRCLDCLRGFEVWRGKITTNSCKKPRTILTKVGSKTTFRKNIHDDV